MRPKCQPSDPPPSRNSLARCRNCCNYLQTLRQKNGLKLKGLQAQVSRMSIFSQFLGPGLVLHFYLGYPGVETLTGQQWAPGSLHESQHNDESSFRFSLSLPPTFPSFGRVNRTLTPSYPLDRNPEVIMEWDMIITMSVDEKLRS